LAPNVQGIGSNERRSFRAAKRKSIYAAFQIVLQLIVNGSETKKQVKGLTLPFLLDKSSLWVLVG